MCQIASKVRRQLRLVFGLERFEDTFKPSCYKSFRNRGDRRWHWNVRKIHFSQRMQIDRKWKGPRRSRMNANLYKENETVDWFIATGVKFQELSNHLLSLSPKIYHTGWRTCFFDSLLRWQLIERSILTTSLRICTDNMNLGVSVVLKLAFRRSRRIQRNRAL